MPFVLLLLACLSVPAWSVRPAVPEERPFSWHEKDEIGGVRVAWRPS